MRPLTDAEREAMEAGLRSPVAHHLGASAGGEHVKAIARSLGCDEQIVRKALYLRPRPGT